MNWKEEMRKAMLMIQSACQRSSDDCQECPFDKFCDYIYDGIFLLPEEWNLESEED